MPIFAKKQISGMILNTNVKLNLGLNVLRYSNAEVNNAFRGVCEDILRHIPSAESSHQKEKD